MRIVFVTQALPYLPCRDGFRLYAANLLRALGRRHQIDLIALVRDDDRDHLTWAKDHSSTLTTLPVNGGKSLLTPVNWFTTYAWGKPLQHRKEIAAMLGGAAGATWDVLHVEGSYAGGLIPADLPMPCVLSLHDSWKLRCAQMATCSPTARERLYYRLVSQVEPRYERLVYPRFDCCVVVGGTDARAIHSVAPNCEVAIVPNGIDTEYYRPMPRSAGNPVLVFHGNLEYAPNVQAALEFARDIFPRIRQQSPQAEFHLVGSRPTKQIREVSSLPGIKLSADLPDLRSALGAAHVYVCPLRYGTGVKNKLLEAMAMGLPIISYPEAVNGIGCVPGKHLMLADDAQEFARLALNLLRLPRQAEILGQEARFLVEEDFSWDSRAVHFEKLYRAAIEKRSARGRLPSSSRPVGKNVFPVSGEVTEGQVGV